MRRPRKAPGQWSGPRPGGSSVQPRPCIGALCPLDAIAEADAGSGAGLLHRVIRAPAGEARSGGSKRRAAARGAVSERGGTPSVEGCETACAPREETRAKDAVLCISHRHATRAEIVAPALRMARATPGARAMMRSKSSARACATNRKKRITHEISAVECTRGSVVPRLWSEKSGLKSVKTPKTVECVQHFRFAGPKSYCGFYNYYQQTARNCSL